MWSSILSNRLLCLTVLSAQNKTIGDLNYRNEFRKLQMSNANEFETTFVFFSSFSAKLIQSFIIVVVVVVLNLMCLNAMLQITAHFWFFFLVRTSLLFSHSFARSFSLAVSHFDRECENASLRTDIYILFILAVSDHINIAICIKWQYLSWWITEIMQFGFLWKFLPLFLLHSNSSKKFIGFFMKKKKLVSEEGTQQEKNFFLRF